MPGTTANIARMAQTNGKMVPGKTATNGKMIPGKTAKTAGLEGNGGITGTTANIARMAQTNGKMILGKTATPGKKEILGKTATNGKMTPGKTARTAGMEENGDMIGTTANIARMAPKNGKMILGKTEIPGKKEILGKTATNGKMTLGKTARTAGMERNRNMIGISVNIARMAPTNGKMIPGKETTSGKETPGKTAIPGKTETLGKTVIPGKTEILGKTEVLGRMETQVLGMMTNPTATGNKTNLMDPGRTVLGEEIQFSFLSHENNWPSNLCATSFSRNKMAIAEHSKDRYIEASHCLIVYTLLGNVH